VKTTVGFLLNIFRWKVEGSRRLHSRIYSRSWTKGSSGKEEEKRMLKFAKTKCLRCSACILFLKCKFRGRHRLYSIANRVKELRAKISKETQRCNNQLLHHSLLKWMKHAKIIKETACETAWFCKESPRTCDKFFYCVDKK